MHKYPGHLEYMQQSMSYPVRAQSVMVLRTVTGIAVDQVDMLEPLLLEWFGDKEQETIFLGTYAYINYSY